jgi:hypothetical protein
MVGLLGQVLVRHEALFDRMEVKDRHRLAVAAVGQGDAQSVSAGQ